MKNKILKISAILLVTLTLTGCTTLLKDADNKTVQNKTTGQNLPANVLCKPQDKETIKIYEDVLKKTRETLEKKLKAQEITKKEYDKKIKGLVNINDLQVCENYSITSGGYEGIWETIFVKPLAWLIINVGKILKNYGLAIIATTLLIRVATISFTKKTALQSEKMKEARPELDKLEKKYKNKTDQQAQMQKNQEMMMIYKKYGINPMSGCLFAFIQIPLFFAFYEAMSRLPLLFEADFLGLQMGTNPWTAITNGNYHYLIITVLVLVASYYSLKLNSGASMSADQEKQMKMMTNISVVMFFFASFTLSTGIALYWITNNSFTIIQNLYVKRRKKNATNN